MIVLGLDASTSSTGWAIFSDGELIVAGVVHPKNDNWRLRIKYIIENILKLFEEYNIEKIIMEDVPMENKNIVTLHKLSVLQGWITCIADQHSITVDLLSPNQWRSKLGMFDGTKEGRKRNALKQKAITMANEIFGLELKKSHDDIAEAILVGYSFFK